MSNLAQPLFGADAGGARVGARDENANVLAPSQWHGGLADGRAGRVAPFVSWLSVDGFGALANLEIPDLSPGLNVLLGENEAGKSTLFDFVTGVLFGFPSRKADDRFRLPVSGGRHGGRVGIVDANGDLVVVERHGAPQRQLVLTLADGSPGDENDLADLLGGANKDLFRAVFAVDLDDLRRLDGLSSDEVRETLFSSSVAGQRRSATRALRELDSLREALVKPRQGGKANLIATDLREIRKELARARSQAEGFARLQRDADRMGEDVKRLYAQLGTARLEARDLGLLQRCWTVVVTRRQASARLAELPPLSVADAQVLAADSRLASLRVALSGHVERLDQFDQAQDRCAALGQSIEDRVEKLGPWSLEVAADSSVDLVALRQQLEECSANVAKASADRDSARRVVARSRAELPPGCDPDPAGRPGFEGPGVEGPGVEGPGVEGPGVEGPGFERPGFERPGVAAPGGDLGAPGAGELDGLLRSLRELRGLVVEADTLGREVEHDVERERIRRVEEAARPHPSPLPGGSVMTAVSALALAVIAAVLLLRGQPGVGALVGLGAAAIVAVAAVSLVTSRRRQGSDGPRAAGEPLEPLPDLWAERNERLRTIHARIAKQAAECGVPDPVLLVSVERAMDSVEEQLTERRRLDDLARIETGLVNRFLAAKGELEIAEGVLAKALENLSGVAGGSGLPISEEASRLLPIVSQLVELRERMEAIRRIDAEAGQTTAEIRRFEASVYELASSLGLQVEGPRPGDRAHVGAEELERVLSSAETRLTAARSRSAERTALESTRDAADRELDRVLGEGEHADSLRADLASGRVLEWEARASASDERVQALEESYEHSLREHEGALRQLDELVRSDDIPVLELACQALETDLDAAMKEYLATSGARLLVQRTLRRYAAERQPAVVSCAGEHFARVTDGRYVRLVVDSAQDGSNPAVQVVKANGSLIDAAALSRGTVEQLYLCLRLALAESFAERYLPLPIVLDDVLVNFDPVRSEAIARELADAALHHQVLALTCHPHLAELISSVASDARVVELTTRS